MRAYSLERIRCELRGRQDHGDACTLDLPRRTSGVSFPSSPTCTPEWRGFANTSVIWMQYVQSASSLILAKGDALPFAYLTRLGPGLLCPRCTVSVSIGGDRVLYCFRSVFFQRENGGLDLAHPPSDLFTRSAFKPAFVRLGIRRPSLFQSCAQLSCQKLVSADVL